MKAYKKSCDKNGEIISKLLKEKIDQAIEEGENVEKIHMWEDLGPVGIRAIFESFSEINYIHTKSIRLWVI
jgi:hypothetical protein